MPPETGDQPTDGPITTVPEIIRDELRTRVHRQADRVQQTASDVQENTHRRVANVQERATRIRTQLAFRREKRDPIRHRLSILTVRIVSRFAAALPYRVRLALGMMIGSLVFRLNSGFRENIQDNLRHVLGPDADPALVERTTRSISRNGIHNILDLLTTPHQSPDDLARDVTFDDETIERMERLRSDTKGVIVLTGHLGSFDMIGVGLTNRGYPCTALTGRTTYRVLFDAIAYLRGSHGALVVEPTPSGVRELYRSLRRGAMVGIVTDRDFFQNGLPVSFFGSETTLPPGAVRIARDTGAAILPVFARREGRRHVIRSQEPFMVERTSDAAADIEAGMRRMVAALEREIGAEPDQWSIFQRVWPDSH
ncbi:MAG TPA: hypothetical protein VGT61_03845 [Thermomicrobiales bacterium]|nr:hypothetical protein [Thermomicrobiales bacterium]